MRSALNDHWTLSGAGFRIEGLRLPLSIPRALAEAGIVETDDAGLNGLHGEWIYRRHWTLERQVDLQQFTHERAILSLPGLCGHGEIRIDGGEAARFDGAAEIEVTESILRGACSVSIVFAPQEGCACTPFGLAEGAQLRGVNALRLREGCVLAGDTALRAFVHVEPYMPGRYVFRYAFEQDGNALGSIEFEHTLAPVPTRLEHLLEASEGFEDAVRWREGADNAPLHVRLLILCRGEACDAALMRTGLRRIDRANPAPGLNACVSGIDGRKAALLGACYAPQPLDAGVAVVRQARAAGMTALYVLSRAGDAFYDACDAQGLMVFQELPLEEAAAEAMIRALGAHPCIVQWGCAPVEGTCGRMTDAAHPAIAALPGVLNRLADERPFAGAAPAHASPGMDVLLPGRMLHAAGPEYPLGPELTARYFNQDTAPYRTMLMPALLRESDLRRAAGEYSCWPMQESRPLWAHRGGIWPPAERTQLRDFLGEDVWDDVGLLSRLTRLWQAESARYAVEQARVREAFGFFALRLGTDRTYLSDDVLIEAHGQERPAYRALAHALRPIHVCARLDRTGYWADTRLEAFVRVLCAAPRAAEGVSIEAALYRGDGTALCREAFPCALQTGEYGCLRTQLPDEPGALVLRLTLRADGEVIDQSDQILCVGLSGPLWPLAHLTGTPLQLRAGMLKNVGALAALGVSAPGLGWRCLLPGEGVAYAGAQEAIECLNAVWA